MATAKKGSRTAASRSKSTARTSRSAAKSKISLSGSLYELMTMTFFGRVILVLLIGAVLIGINLMVSSNRYDLFYILCGIELIAAIIIGWLRMLLRPE